MGCKEYMVKFPDREDDLDQNEEWVRVEANGKCEKIRIHDYSRFYSIPDLYEEVVYRRLKCVSPHMVCRMLRQEIRKENYGSLRVLDFGAGNGMVGECLRKDLSCEYLVGVDIIEEAKMAASRDREGVYDDYWVLDFCNLDDKERKKIAAGKFNALITVAALGFGDIPTQAFVNALNVMENGSWVAFNIKETFLAGEDKSGYKKLIETLTGKSICVLNNRHYRHRFSISGEPLYYWAIVGKKEKEVSWENMAEKNCGTA